MRGFHHVRAQRHRQFAGESVATGMKLRTSANRDINGDAEMRIEES